MGVLLLAGCRGRPEPSPTPAQDLGSQTARIVNDTDVFRDAQDAVNAVVRNATDCEAAKAAMPEANRKIEEAAGRIQTAAGRTTLDALRAQVNRVAELCP
jgi:outer membrane murein-binding lipoprotein Lpp